MPLKIAEDYEKRGVENPRIIDLITRDPARGEVVLKIFEGRPWKSTPEQLQQLEDKLNSYFGYVLDGFLAEQYPQYAGVPVCIQLECVEPPGEGEEDFIFAVTHFSARHDIRFRVEVVDDPFAQKGKWEG